MSHKKWSGRALTSLCSLASFILLGFTGIILYLEPHGRVAYWTKWSLLGLEKDQWGNIHVFSGLLFLVAGGFHVYYNWKPLMRYLGAKIENALHYKREMVISGLIFLWIFISGILFLPPLTFVADLGEHVKDSWVTAPGLEPPFGHAELVSLKTFCVKQRIPLDQAMVELRKAGFKVDGPMSTLTEIADGNGASGMDVYEVIKKLEAKPEPILPGEAWSPEKVEEVFAGTSLGRKTIAQILDEWNLNPEAVHQRLDKSGIQAKEEDNFKDLADKHKTTPIKLLTIILVGTS